MITFPTFEPVDLLGESSESVCIILQNASALQEALGGYYTALCGMLADLSKRDRSLGFVQLD